MPQVTEAVFYCNYLVDGFVIFSQAERGGWRWGEGVGRRKGGRSGGRVRGAMAEEGRNAWLSWISNP